MTDIFSKQKELQEKLGLGVGGENITQWYNSLTGAMLEIGEALAEDTRWKRNFGSNKVPKVNKANVIEETADAVLYIINACIFYGISCDDLMNAIKTKQARNVARLTRRSHV